MRHEWTGIQNCCAGTAIHGHLQYIMPPLLTLAGNTSAAAAAVEAAQKTLRLVSVVMTHALQGSCHMHAGTDYQCTAAWELQAARACTSMTWTLGINGFKGQHQCQILGCKRSWLQPGNADDAARQALSHSCMACRPSC